MKILMGSAKSNGLVEKSCECCFEYLGSATYEASFALIKLVFLGRILSQVLGLATLGIQIYFSILLN